MHTNNSQQAVLKPLLIIGGMYAILGFSIGINAFFIPFVQQAFNISTAMSYLIMTATFAAYVIFGFPSGTIIKKIGYRSAISLSFLLIGIGFLIIGYAASIVSFPLFLLALFLSGMGQTLLTSAVNSYVTILGPPESAASRICMMGICDKVFFAGASLILASFLQLSHVRLSDVITPFYWIAGLLGAIAIISYFSSLPEIKAIGEDEDAELSIVSATANLKTSIFQFPHVWLGALAIFFDVGVEIVALGSINDYASILHLRSPENYVWYTVAGMVAGYIVGVALIPKVVSQRTALVMCTVLGVITSTGIVLVPAASSIYLITILGLSNSLLWPAIFPLALADLGRFTKRGSSILVMGIIGGAILPLLYGYLADVSSHQMAYLVCLPSYLFIFYYAVSGSKIRTSVRLLAMV
jgi:FHS family L-fucose permease-like MFS transporter